MQIKTRPRVEEAASQSDLCDPPSVDAKTVRRLMLRDPRRRELILREEMIVAGAAVVKAARAHAGLTQAQLAQTIGVTQSRVAQMERGIDNGGSVLELLTLARVAHACGRELKLELV